MRHVGILTENLVRGIKEDESLVRQGIIDEALQLILGKRRACRVVRESEIENVGFLCRQIWIEIILL